MEKKEIDIIEMSIKEIKGLIYEISQAYDSERRMEILHESDHILRMLESANQRKKGEVNGIQRNSRESEAG